VERWGVCSLGKSAPPITGDEDNINKPRASTVVEPACSLFVRGSLDRLLRHVATKYENKFVPGG
jgi:hypothetical protein